MMTVAEATLKMPKPGVPGAKLRWITRLLAPGPRIVRSLSIANSPLVNVMRPLTAKVTVSPEAALAMAWRSEPDPLSAVVVTVAAHPHGKRSIAMMAKTNGIDLFDLFMCGLRLSVPRCVLKRNDSFSDGTVLLALSTLS